jgi:2-aminoethylphosphonate-pyruvate transaminase
MAAGMGTRLGEMGKGIPKGFMRLGEKTIIEESIDRLVSVGITRILIVTGHLSECYEELAAASGGLVETVHNPLYADSGSLYSLYLAREKVAGPFLLLESDLIYETRALRLLVEQPEPDVMLLSGETRSGDEVYVETANGCLKAMGKDRAALGPQITGELVGISLVSAALYAQICRVAGEWFKKTLHFHYEQGLVEAGRTVLVRCLLVPDLIWSEIDDPSHLARARATIYPHLAG